MPDNVKKDVSLNLPIHDIAGSCYVCGQSCCQDVQALFTNKFKSMEVEIASQVLEMNPLRGFSKKNTESFQVIQSAAVPSINFYAARDEYRLETNAVGEGFIDGQRGQAWYNKGPTPYGVSKACSGGGGFFGGGITQHEPFPNFQRNIAMGIGVKTDGPGVIGNQFHKTEVYDVIGHIETYRFITVMGEDVEVTSVDTIDDQPYDIKKLWETGKTATVLTFNPDYVSPADEGISKYEFMEVPARGKYSANRCAIMIKGLNSNDHKAQRSLHPQNLASGQDWNMALAPSLDLYTGEYRVVYPSYYDLNRFDEGDNESLKYTNSECPFHLVMIKYDTPIIIGQYTVHDVPKPFLNDNRGSCGILSASAPESYVPVIEVVSTVGKNVEVEKDGWGLPLGRRPHLERFSANPFGIDTRYGPSGGLSFDTTDEAIRFIKDSWIGHGVITQNTWASLGGYDTIRTGVHGQGFICLDRESITLGTESLDPNQPMFAEVDCRYQPKHVVLRKSSGGTGVDFVNPDTYESSVCIHERPPVGKDYFPDIRFERFYPQLDSILPLNGEGEKPRSYNASVYGAGGCQETPSRITISSVKFSGVEELAKVREFSFTEGSMNTIFEKDFHYHNLYPQLKSGACVGGTLPYDWDGALTTWSAFINAQARRYLPLEESWYGRFNDVDHIFDIHSPGNVIDPLNKEFRSKPEGVLNGPHGGFYSYNTPAWIMKHGDSRYFHNSTIVFNGEPSCSSTPVNPFSAPGGGGGGALEPFTESYGVWIPLNRQALESKIYQNKFADYEVFSGGNLPTLRYFYGTAFNEKEYDPFLAETLDETAALGYLTTVFTSNEITYGPPTSTKITEGIPVEDYPVVDASNWTVITETAYTQPIIWPSIGTQLLDRVSGTVGISGPGNTAVSTASIGDFSAKYPDTNPYVGGELVWWRGANEGDGAYRDDQGTIPGFDSPYTEVTWPRERKDLQKRQFSAIDVARIGAASYSTSALFTLK